MSMASLCRMARAHQLLFALEVDELAGVYARYARYVDVNNLFSHDGQQSVRLCYR